MTEELEALRDVLGKEMFDKIKALAKKGKAERKSPEEIKAELQAKFGEDIAKKIIPFIFV